MGAAIARKIALAISFVFLSLTGASAQDAERLGLRLVPDAPEIGAGAEFRIGLAQSPAPGWHTYWINPGDTGYAPVIDWELPQGVELVSVAWPAPTRLQFAGGVMFGYEAQSTPVFTFRTAPSTPIGETIRLTAHVDDLVCADVCTPIVKDLNVDLKTAATPSAGPGALDNAVARLPQTLNAPGRVFVSNNHLKAEYPLRSLPKELAGDFLKTSHADIFLETADLVAPDAASAVSSSSDTLSIDFGPAADAVPQDGVGVVFASPSGRAYRALFRSVAQPIQGAENSHALVGLWTAALFAFIGGLILNLMPCVFPVLSIKLMALARAGDTRAEARREALFFAAGVLATFMALALSIETAKQLGAAVGWGFQLQSPIMTGALSAVMLLVALNMSGLFEAGGALQALAGQAGVRLTLPERPGVSAFFTGVLAVMVAAPCTAPFMATAVGAALVAGTMSTLTIFAALGAGFAAPFVALVYAISSAPKLIDRLPRPGAWMVRVRHALALPMYAAALWLCWVFFRQTGPIAAAGLCVGLGAVAFVALSARRRMTLGGALVSLAAVASAATAFIAAGALKAPDHARYPTTEFSQETLNAALDRGEPVLVDLTADWCVTCKVNELRVLKNPKVIEALDQRGVTLMVGDWTRRDEAITRYLASFDRSGVPLYVYYDGAGGTPRLLPQLLDVDQVIGIISGDAAEGRAAAAG